MTYAVEFNDVSRLYGDVRAVDGVTIGIRDGEFFSMLGPSGSGKTTCLRLIAGFEQLSGGAIKIFGKEASELPPWERDVNTVFQDYALFPHMSIIDNVAYGLMVKGVDKKKRQSMARDALEKVGLGFAEKRKPSQLSGGQRQRVAIARALVNEPRVLLLDEPLGALDLKLREQMQFELKKLQQELGITFIFVTHDQGEALSMSDRVAVFNNGRIEQVDTPRELYMRPRTPFVASFVGTSNVFDAAVARQVCGMEGIYSLRPEHIRLNESGDVQVQGVVQAVQYQGAATRFELRLADGAKLLVSQANLSGANIPLDVAPGQQVLASWSREAMVPLHEER
ncbi:ABC transporter ATP-binding protein [Lelliottia sp. V106_10]|uniref:ABC transporter ATP-binding protein n=1 Tax=Lelliottia wanjuensis TaxID=3050585 RepID=UPI00254E8B41|nr:MULTISPECIES: ABC transporter ATP-binding protein [unclassified Lelliottia]MDK9356401.1 ABC transporter ATP-binding protein [Lelliottia sp. V106_16]MDK9375744.1 ABC transporter ATP-binding protein [Lelliottia sp. V106_10]MDK9602294.1 ABC transporter ATP-binding protein [Lelliottia sp. V106_5]